ncbi:MAG: nucleoside hydrolase-like domain-containing protein [Rhodopirellula sp. JB044]|uniref:DUF1593 domain-containing protein n=1 Tax=Rhodopirellula sp. JB044 TaxID=3342844 RepID=UPI00370CC019
MAEKPRVLVLTDVSTWETDDHESLIRLFAHADMFEIEGLVMTTGYSISTLNKSPENGFINIIHGVVDAYEKDLPNLIKRSGQTGHAHDDDAQKIGYWPSADYLRKRIVVGSPNRGIKFIGDDNDSAGSELLIELADEKDDRPLWIGIWGGGNTLAQAIYKVKKDRSPTEFKMFLNKLRAYAITDQDRSYKGEGHEISSHGWIYKQTGSDLKFIWDESAWKQHNGMGKSRWNQYAEHIQNHGHMGSQYPKYKYGVEGDTPAFLYIMPNGLNDPEDPTQSSWGGNFVKKGGGLWREANSCAANFKQTYPAAFNNFAARMDWAKDGKGNRNPVLDLDGDKGLTVITKTLDQGASATLDASATTDPDGDDLKFKWWVQGDAGTYRGDVKLFDTSSSKVTVEVPADAKGQTFHVICEVTDDGTHNLSSYRRVIFKATGEAPKSATSAAAAKKKSKEPVAQEAHSNAAGGKTNSFASWLREYIPVQYAGAKIADHGHWWQAKVGEPVLQISWAEIPEKTLGVVHGLYPGKALFIAKPEPSAWSEVENVKYVDGVGYYVSAYNSETMGDWNVQGIAVVQYTGEESSAAEFSAAAAKTWKELAATSGVAFRQWLFEYLPAQYPNAEMADKTYWLQGKIGDKVGAYWTEWTDEDSTLKAMEAHNLVAGKSMFIEQKGDKKQDWADNPAVTHYEGGGYYISGYDPATMSDWDGKGLSVIQFDGDSKELARVIGMGWARRRSLSVSSSVPQNSCSTGGEPAAGEPYAPFPSNVVVTKVKHFDNMCWKIAAAGGTWYFENGETDGKTGFSSAFDQAGNDWIGNDRDRGYNKSSARGGRHEYRGWPNFGNGNFNHPQRSSHSKSWWVDSSGNEIAFDDKLEGDHLVMRSSNDKYDIEYHFFPSHAAIKVLKADDKYAFLFEGPIGGEQDASVDKDFYVLKDGKHRECREGGLGYLNPEFGNKFPSPFFYLEDSDPKDTQIWYAGVKNAGPESAGDEGWRQGSNMVIFSFGRDEDKRAYTGTDAVCVFGFFDKAEHSEISGFIESRLDAPFEVSK